MIRIGIAGLGAAGRAFVPAVRSHAAFRLAAIADPSPEIRAEFAAAGGPTPYPDFEAMLGDASLDAVCIATPTDLHAEQARAAFAAGKHVLLEKPMATSIADARAIIEAAARAGKVLLVGHSHSYDAPIARMRAIVEGGTLGAPRMANTWCFTDWVYRPRRPEELDLAKGGGVAFRQGAHQFDILRLLCGGRARSVRARTFDNDAARSTVGAFVAFVDFADGAAGTAVYSGYGHLPGAELTFGIGEWGFPQAPAKPRAAQASATSPEEELRAKAQRARTAIPAQAPHPPFFGLTILCCERGDVRQVPEGLAIHSRDGASMVPVCVARSPRELLLDEFHDAIAGVRPAVHDGLWALATLELCIGALESARTGREVALAHQCAPARAVAEGLR
ncbi:MAG TPA: Gfo/Idh/MocA family oxidoreductase [Usitatibacter sp.]|nr:Gfo/Idh/MocA family oxidoreductase [Usitatibacter sp.]